jgi:hypothetical protein
MGFALLAPLIGLGWSDAGLHVALAAGALIVTFVMFSTTLSRARRRLVEAYREEEGQRHVAS